MLSLYVLVIIHSFLKEHYDILIKKCLWSWTLVWYNGENLGVILLYFLSPFIWTKCFFFFQVWHLHFIYFSIDYRGRDISYMKSIKNYLIAKWPLKFKVWQPNHPNFPTTQKKIVLFSYSCLLYNILPSLSEKVWSRIESWPSYIYKSCFILTRSPLPL